MSYSISNVRYRQIWLLAKLGHRFSLYCGGFISAARSVTNDVHSSRKDTMARRIETAVRQSQSYGESVGQKARVNRAERLGGVICKRLNVVIIW